MVEEPTHTSRVGNHPGRFAAPEVQTRSRARGVDHVRGVFFQGVRAKWCPRGGGKRVPRTTREGWCPGRRTCAALNVGAGCAQNVLGRFRPEQRGRLRSRAPQDRLTRWWCSVTCWKGLRRKGRPLRWEERSWRPRRQELTRWSVCIRGLAGLVLGVPLLRDLDHCVTRLLSSHADNMLRDPWSEDASPQYWSRG